MKKFIISTLSVLVLCLLVGCGETTVKPTETPTTNTNTEPLDEFWDADQNGIADWTEKEITLTYATWQTHEDTMAETIDAMMINEFEKLYPNINIDMVFVSESDGWQTALQALAETGSLPDVFLVNRLESTIAYNMLADITEYYNHDSDTEYIFESLQQSGVYNGVRYAVPSFVYANWWFVNLDILSANGIEAPGYDWTWEQMEAIASACYDETTHTVGQSGYTEYWKTLPKAISKVSSWASYTFDTETETFNFGSTAFETAITMMGNALNTNACTSPYSVDDILEYYGETVTEYALLNGYNIGFNGHSAIWASPSWTAKDYFSSMTFNWDVYPAPGGTIGGNTDIMGVSSTCANKAAAYQFLKWMSYSEEGLKTRYDIYDKYGDILYIAADNYPYPVADYLTNTEGVNEIWDNLPYTLVAGMTSSEMISALKNGAFVLNKEIPGWDTVDQTVNPYLYEVANGTQQFAAVKATIVSESDRVFKEFNDALKAKIQENLS